MQIPDRNFKKYAIICGCMFVGGLVFAYAIFPPILKFILRSVSASVCECGGRRPTDNGN